MGGMVFYSQSGRFTCDENRILLSFEPAAGNCIGENSFMHLMIPEGVAGFCGDFGKGITVAQSLVLPESLRELGTFESDILGGRNNVFALAKLPAVIIPGGVERYGAFAFGASRLQALCLPKGYSGKTYARQFKDARINKLYVHEEDHRAIFHLDSWYSELYTYQSKAPGCLPTEFTLMPEKRKHPDMD